MVVKQNSLFLMKLMDPCFRKVFMQKIKEGVKVTDFTSQDNFSLEKIRIKHTSSQVLN